MPALPRYPSSQMNYLSACVLVFLPLTLLVVTLPRSPDYFERSYPGSWFTYGAIFDSRVEASDLPSLISSRTRTHAPAFISAYAVTSPRPLVFFSILWQPNSKSFGWAVLFNLDGPMFQDALHRQIASGFKPVQVESYYVSDEGRPYYHEIYYTAFFLADVAWPAGSDTLVETAFGMPHDKSYCSPSASLTEDPIALTPPQHLPHRGLHCSHRLCPLTRVNSAILPQIPSSLRICPTSPTGFQPPQHLPHRGLHCSHRLCPLTRVNSAILPQIPSSLRICPTSPTGPLSISLTEDPIALTVYVADVWSNAPTPAGWQAGVARTEEQLQQELMQLPPPLVPTYLKAYTVGLKVFYAYVARPPTSPTAPHRILTADVSRSGFELLALSLKHPPLLVASFLPPKFEGHGKSARERYTVTDYFERSYPGGWFTYGAILDSRVEASDLPALISSRECNHMPAFITAYAVASPRPLVYFSILWQPNSKSVGWVVVFNLDGQMFQDSLHRRIASGFKPVQVESYYVSDDVRPYYHELYYSAIFLADVAWPAGSSMWVEAAFGMLHDASYCCGPTSRWWRLQRQGFSPLSVSLTEDPAALTVYVADVWSSPPSSGGWLGAVAMTEAELQQALAQLPPPLVPTFLKAYTVGMQVFYAYVARPPSATVPHRTLTADISRSGFELLARSLRQPPLFVTSFVPPKCGEQGKGERERYTLNYFERKYPGGWLTAGPILDSRVESSDLPALLSSRTRSHVPAFVSAYAVASPRPLVFFSILWEPNSKSLGWVMVFNLNGQQFQDSLHHYISSGYKPSQVESYYVADHHGLYYAAIFLADVAWPAGSGTRVEAVFGVPHDSAYCCGPSSRWLQLQRQGYTPLSVSFTEDPSSQRVYVADVWNDAPNRGGWQGGVARTQAQLQQALTQLLPPLVPTFLKAYTVGYQVFYAYIARAASSSPPRSTLTTDVSRSAFELLARSLKQPPLLVSSYGPMDGGAGESDAPGSGEKYAVLWQTDGVGAEAEAGAGAGTGENVKLADQ
ncbi:unnamed protein product [Closterium sp. Naga37s-1]|nr:unnamed protein product [Closterium sp. Naga37s-1]